jgi:hypothetical protein
MFSARGLLAALLFLSISLPTALAVPAPELALGVLTRASDAHLNALPAFPGLSVFEDENISTEVEGKLGVRIGNVMLALLGNTSATLHRINSGTHVDMESGWLYFSSPADSCVEIHAIDALLRPAKNQRTQARVRIDAPHELQVSAILGDLLFIYQDESRIIPEGKTYQINLNPEGATQMPAGTPGGASPSPPRTKIAIFVVAGAASGLAAWGIHHLIESSNGPESPAKP